MILREMELKDTVEMMKSSDYKDRFFAEYWQTKIRYEKLKKFNTRIEAADMTMFEKNSNIEMPKHNCPLHLLKKQQDAMGHYLHILELRAEIEGIDLDKQYDLEVTDWCGVSIGKGTISPSAPNAFESYQSTTYNTQ